MFFIHFYVSKTCFGERKKIVCYFLNYITQATITFKHVNDINRYWTHIIATLTNAIVSDYFVNIHLLSCGIWWVTFASLIVFYCNIDFLSQLAWWVLMVNYCKHTVDKIALWPTNAPRLENQFSWNTQLFSFKDRF